MRIAAWAAGILLTALYAYVLITEIGNLVLLPQMVAGAGIEITPIGWLWLGFGMLLPVAVYVLAWLIARGCRAGVRLLVLAAGLCLVAAVRLEMMHFAPQSLFFS